jgi:predicted dithiol-disulfide oxidoreductase (DUF899 family)
MGCEVKFDNTKFAFDTSAGPKTLLDLLAGQRQLSNMPLAQIEAYKSRLGWTMPFVSSRALGVATGGRGAGGT